MANEEKLSNILLIDDEAIIGMATKRKLEKLGYSVILAARGEDAIRIAGEADSISMVLMDIDLGPGKNGIDVCREILKARNIPIVFVSSHTEREIVSLTEQVTSYGYVVKDSSITVYDASIKMAYKLFNEKVEKERYSKYLITALNNATEPIFITDMKGDIVFFNKAYLGIQGLSDPALIPRKFEEYTAVILVFSDDGTKLESDDWASTRGLRGLSGEGVIFHVYHRVLNALLTNYYAYAPIYDDSHTIIGSYVKIMGRVEHPDPEVIDKIFRHLGITHSANPH